VEICGIGNGIPAVMVHGFGSSDFKHTLMAPGAESSR